MVNRLLKSGHGREAVTSIVEISKAGRAASNDPALFALAALTGAQDNVAVRQAALSALPQVARTGTHLLHFVQYAKQFRGWGRAYRRAVAAWFNDRKERDLAYQLLKYQSRDGYAQRDLLRLAHPRPETSTYKHLYHWVTKGWDAVGADPHPDPALQIIWAFEKAKRATSDKEVAQLIKTYRLPREAVPTERLNSIEVWEALLEDMPLEAMLRNLATMTRIGLLRPLSAGTIEVIKRLGDEEAIKRARLHPIKILTALKTYQSGRGLRGQHTWTPLSEITDTLNLAFYHAFANVEPSGKRIVLALDVSGSMSSGTVAGVEGLTPREGSSAMALVTAATEPHHTIMAFSNGFIPLPISPRQRLDDVVRMTHGMPFSGTDCAVPMLWAMQNKIEADAFVIYTDSETWFGRIHPVQALQAYRQQSGIPARLIVVGMTSNGFTIADSSDAGMLDVVGFDTAAPAMISSFIKGAF